eukprot:CAMPEP_0184703428 /NCGR_PEP_ID=MMETSP0313-20130426/27767_1 /TAXON_ID=2792 /ORGANISM="Porphyridium aerugineum, Strain SAG 1380-2" /LENGTH=342 /DNA_ID=CAMNT_0027164191 /DNA_START=104 /DNA_END=1129 /DNA_ORIENTATION=-
MDDYKVLAHEKYMQFVSKGSHKGIQPRLAEVTICPRASWKHLDEWLVTEKQKFWEYKHYGWHIEARCPFAEPGWKWKHCLLGGCSEMSRGDHGLAQYCQDAKEKFQRYLQQGYHRVVKKATSPFFIPGMGDLPPNVTKDTVAQTIPEQVTCVTRERYQKYKKDCIAQAGCMTSENNVQDWVLVAEFFVREYAVLAAAKYMNRYGDDSSVCGKRKQLTLCALEAEYNVVLDKYRNLPDEIYRRKSSKQFAIYRRVRLQMEKEEASRLKQAELAMAMSRAKKSDHLRTYERHSAGDHSFRTMMFSNENTTYVYTNSITVNHSKREEMIQKYLTRQGEELDIDPL